MATFELGIQPDSATSQLSGWAGLEARDLLRNARWFTRIRWSVVLLFLAGGLLGALLPESLAAIGLNLPAFELSSMALFLAALNLLYLRSHYLRMPLYLLLPHLVRKAWMRRQDESETT